MSPEPETTETGTCPVCDCAFTPTAGTRQKYCSRRCRAISHQAPRQPPTTHTCPVCEAEFVTHPSVRQVYCSPACRIEQERRRDQARDNERARRLGESPARTSHPRPAPARATRGPEPLAPAATRDCPHCGQPVTIVALLATPEAARPTITQPGGDVIALRRA